MNTKLTARTNIFLARAKALVPATAYKSVSVELNETRSADIAATFAVETLGLCKCFTGAELETYRARFFAYLRNGAAVTADTADHAARILELTGFLAEVVTPAAVTVPVAEVSAPATSPISDTALPMPTKRNRVQFQQIGNGLKTTLREARAQQAAARLTMERVGPSLADDATDAEFDLWRPLHEAACLQAGIDEANRRVRETEDALLAWGEVVTKAYFPAKYREFSDVFEAALKRPKYRTPLLDTLLRLKL